MASMLTENLVGTDLFALMGMFDRAGMKYEIETDVEGWAFRLKMRGDDRCFVFAPDKSLAGVRSLDDLQSFDGD